MSDSPSARLDRDAEAFDYVVVGGGSSGCIVAAELSDAGFATLLLEAGEPAEANPETLASDGYKRAFVNDRLMWDRLSEPQRGLGGRRIFLGSGRGMGGSGSINAMVYTRGDRRDYDEWPPGWRWDDLAPDFARLERRLRVRRMDPTAFTEACIAAAESATFRRKDDLNDGDLSGFLGYEWMNVEGEGRRSSYVAFVKDQPRPALRIETNAKARRVILDGARAVGVEYEQAGTVRAARARREVVLAAGALETPRLLLLSGVGPRDELARHGIPLAVESPGVGRNLQDHPNVALFFLGRRPPDCDRPQLYGFHRALPASPLPAGQADTCYVFYPARSSFREGAMRMLPTMLLPAPLYRLGWLRRVLRSLVGGLFALPPVARLVARMWGIVVVLGKPRSRGTLRLASADPRTPARIDPAYFADPADEEALLAGVALARRVAAAPAMAAWGNRPLMPPGSAEGRGLAKFVRRNIMTTYHYAGTCRLGDVLDDRLRVRGALALRVADASAIPSVPVSAMNAPSMLLGARCARFLLEDAARPR